MELSSSFSVLIVLSLWDSYLDHSNRAVFLNTALSLHVYLLLPLASGSFIAWILEGRAEGV